MELFVNEHGGLIVDALTSIILIEICASICIALANISIICFNMVL